MRPSRSSRDQPTTGVCTSMKTVLKLVLAVALAGCLVGVGVAIGTSGGDSAPTATAAQESDAVPANESMEATSTPDPDTDGDGVNDPADAAPHNPQVQDEADKKTCTYLGINHE